MLKKIREKIQAGPIVVGITIACFLAYKLLHLTFRFGDGDVYWYMMQSLWQGLLPYRNFFLSDPPVFILFLAFLKPLFGAHWLWYQALPVFLESLNAIILYLILRPKTKLAFIAAPLYLISFTILATSDFSTGVQLTICLSLCGWLFMESQRQILSGLAWGLSILTKLYALPAFLGLLGFTVWKKQPWFRVALAVIAVGVSALLPFFIASPHGFINSIITTQFHRPAGNDRGSVWLFFFRHEWVLILFGLLGAGVKANRKYLGAFLLTAVFFVLFKDLYYLYLAYLFPFLIIFAVTLFDRVWADVEIRPLAVVMGLLLTWSCLGGFLAYQNSVLTQGRFLNVIEIAEYLKTLNAHQQIYGSHELAPILALYSVKSIYGNFIDTNPQAFAAHTFNLEQVSQQAAAAGVYLLARITDLPDYGIKDQGFEGYFSRSVFDQHCQRLKFFDSTSQESDNYIGVYDCHN